MNQGSTWLWRRLVTKNLPKASSKWNKKFELSPENTLRYFTIYLHFHIINEDTSPNTVHIPIFINFLNSSISSWPHPLFYHVGRLSWYADLEHAGWKKKKNVSPTTPQYKNCISYDCQTMVCEWKVKYNTVLKILPLLEQNDYTPPNKYAIVWFALVLPNFKKKKKLLQTFIYNYDPS